MTANAEQREHWNADEAQHWLRYEAVHGAMLEPFGTRLLDAASLRLGDRVLDVGCGTGWTTLRAAEAVGHRGAAVGIDLSEAMLDRARQLASAAGLVQARFEVADAQTDSFTDGPFNVAISRFGVMFFDDPVAAFANTRRSLAPGGRLCFVCWQELAANEWMLVPGAAVATHVALPALAESDEPGPFSLSDPDRTGSLLRDAGFASVDVVPVETTMTLGHGLTLDETVEYLRTSGLGRAVLGDATPDIAARAMESVRAALEPYATATGVQLGACAWLVTARSGDTPPT